jgi:hypothetical protein
MPDLRIRVVQVPLRVAEQPRRGGGGPADIVAFAPPLADECAYARRRSVQLASSSLALVNQPTPRRLPETGGQPGRIKGHATTQVAHESG